MSSIFCLPPLLFVTLRETYGISYTLLGTLVLTNFCTQLAVDILFTLFAKHFNVQRIVRVMPLITSAGLMIYALVPTFFPAMAYPGLLIGTVVFSVSAGLSEVLLSPTIAAIPSENPQRDMSMLHSLYAFGVFTIVLISTVFLKLFSAENWVYLTIFLALLPIAAAVLFMLSPMPDMSASAHGNTKKRGQKGHLMGQLLCVGCIFFGSCAENAMSNWISGYMETALGIDKAVGDILGVAAFAILLGMARISYAKFGKHIGRVLLVGMIGAAACYLIVGLSSNVVFAFVACILTGFFVSMLWPGSLIMMEEKIPGVGVTAFALMAAGGDLGASLAPQLLGVVVDRVSASDYAARLSAELGLGVEQIGLKAGMLVCAIFPILGAVLLVIALRYFQNKQVAESTDDPARV
ncbi:MAG: MFS transporter [Clostridia bacterium]|nr:MFS transporter [Clostridia bacterium]